VYFGWVHDKTASVLCTLNVVEGLNMIMLFDQSKNTFF
jgi:hypothetical protein